MQNTAVAHARHKDTNPAGPILPAMRVLAAVNGRIHTLDPANPSVEALLAVDGTIALTGTTVEVREAAARHNAGETLDLEGKCAFPGFTDSHIHFVSYGLNLERVELTGAASIEIVRERVDAAAWATALKHGWSEADLRQVGYDAPTRRAPGRPRRRAAATGRATSATNGARPVGDAAAAGAGSDPEASDALSGVSGDE